MIVNASVQIVPLNQNKEVSYKVIDEIITFIQSSNLKFRIGAFETSLEGEFEDIRKLLKEIEEICYNKHNIEFLIYTKLHLSGGKNILFEDKKLDR